MAVRGVPTADTLDYLPQATEEALKPPVGPPWNRRLTLQLLRREAEEPIQGPGGKPRSSIPEQRPAAAQKKSDKK
jgi:hypothetical protein